MDVALRVPAPIPALAMTLKTAKFAGLACFAALVGAAPANACTDVNVEPEVLGPTRAAEVATCLVNVERSKRGLRKLKPNTKLTKAARKYARLMVKAQFFDHVSPGGSTPVKRIKATGYMSGALGWSVGENLAWGTGELSTPKSIVRSWMKSPGHRANILRRGFRELGMGVSTGAPVDLYDYESGGTYVTSFGARS